MSLWIFDGLGWLLLLLGPLLFTQRRLHRELQSLFLLLTRRATIALGLFSLLLFPGVFLHEFSHFLMARLMGVRTGKFSLIPQATTDGRLQLGFVETERTDFIRDAMIGAAPLIFGGILVGLLGMGPLGLIPLVQMAGTNDWPGVWKGFLGLTQQPDFWVWFYITFTISATMMPSAADRQSWVPFVLVFAGLFILALLAGGGPWMLENLAPLVNQGLRTIAMVLGVSWLVQFFLLLPIWALRHLTGRIFGLSIQ